MKHSYLYFFFLIYLFVKPVFSNQLEYVDWLNHKNFKSNLYNEIENLILFKIPNIHNKKKEKNIIEEINLHFNQIANYQNNFLNLRKICQSNYNDFSFEFFLDIENCIKDRNTKLINQFSEYQYSLIINHKKLFLNANEFKNLFINLHSHEVKKENYNIIMENYYSNIDKINFDIFENQFMIVINYFTEKYNL